MKAYSFNKDGLMTTLKVEKKKNVRKMECNILNVFPEIEKHKVYGFGGALTHASGEVLNSLDKDKAKEVVSLYYNESGFSYVRIPIDSSDFASFTFEAAGSEEEIRNDEFSFKEEEEYIFPWLDEIERIKGERVKILLSPWSPPAFMKSSRSRLKGGKLLPSFYSLWAEYMARYAKEYIKRGYDVWALTIQNEPNAIQTWDSCVYTSGEEAKIFKLLRESLDKECLEDISILFWDHNKERMISRLSDFTEKEKVDGMAVHGYMGDHFDALDIYRKIYPDKRLVLSEFCMGYKDRDNKKKQLKTYFHEIAGDIAHGVDTVIDWNLILDEEGGPNHVGNYCIAPVMKEGVGYETNGCFTAISALSREIWPSSTVIATSVYDSSIDNVALKRVDGSVCVEFLAKDRKTNVRVGGKVFQVESRKDDLTVLVIEEGEL